MRVVTYSGTTYLYTGGTLTRVLGENSGELRRDGEPITVLRATDPVVGERWELLLQVREDHIQTIRSTSPVVEVHP